MKRHCSTYNILASNRQQTYNSYYEKFADGTVKCIDEEIPFEIPNGWDICRLNDLALYRKGPFGSSLTKSMFVPKSDSSVKVYEQKNAIQKDYRLGDYYISQDKFNGMLSFIVEPGDLIVSCAGTIGETYCLPDEAPIGIINQALMRVKLYDSQLNSYWQLYFKYILNNESQMKGSGSAIKNIPPFEYLKSIIVVLPPLAEQKRIVEELQFLNMLSENYDKLQAELNNLNLSIKDKIRKSILQEAIQGKLIPQDPNDEPASVLLERIRAEKERLIKEQKIKRDKNESVIYKGDDNSYYERIGLQEIDLDTGINYPNNWYLTRLKDVCQLIGGEKNSGNYICLDAKYLRGKSEGTYLNKGRFVHKGDNIILVDGENSGEVFNVPCEGYMGSTFKQLWVCSELYLPYVLYTIQFYKDLLRNSKKGAAIPHLNRNVFNNIILGIPPINEQIKIVSKVNALFEMCR